MYPSPARSPWLARAIAVSLLAIAPAVRAQVNDPNDLFADPNSPDRDPRSIAPGSGLTPTDLIRQIRLNSGQTPGEFRDRQDRRLNDEASEFRRLQEQRIQQRDAATPTGQPGGDARD